MLNIKSAEFIVWFITFFTAYLITITFSGYFRAWVNHKFGDDTAAEQGYLSLNPLAHIDPFGLLTLFLFNVGWGQQIPVNSYLLGGAHRPLKLATAYLSGVIAHLVQAIVALVLLLLLFDKNIVILAEQIIRYRAMSHILVASAYPTAPSLFISIAFILIALIYLNLILSVLSFIMNGSTVGLLLFAERSPQSSLANPYAVIGLPILLLLFFYDPLQELGLYIITCGGFLLAKILHIA